MATTDLLSLGWAAIDWIEHYLVHGPGDVQGQPIELDDEYAAFVVKAYRVTPDAGEKIVRRAFLSRPKGRAKSELAGMLACFEALGPCRFDHWAEAGEVSDWGYEYEEGEPVGTPLRYVEILNVATEEGQAGNTFDNTYFMLHADTCSPEILADFGKLDVGLTRINLPDRRGFIEPVTAANESKDGGKSTFIVADETHLWIPPANGKFKLGKMHQTMARNLLKRKFASGWMLETSTMYAEGEKSVAEGTHAYAKSPAGQNGKLLFDHKQSGDGYDLTKRSDRIKALREVYGPAAAWMPIEEIADSYDDPQVKPNEWERYWTNRPVPLEEKPDSIFPAWGSLNGEDKPPTALAVAGDVERRVLHLAGSDGQHVGIIAPAAFGFTTIPRNRESEFVLEVARISKDLGLPVAIQENSPAWTIRAALEALDVKVEPIDFKAFVQAGSDFEQAINTRTLTHADDPTLNGQVDEAEWRTVNDQLVLSRKKGDASALESVILARHLAHNKPTATEPFALWG